MDEVIPYAFLELPDALAGVLELAGDPVPGKIPELLKRKPVRHAKPVAAPPTASA